MVLENQWWLDDDGGASARTEARLERSGEVDRGVRGLCQDRW